MSRKPEPITPRLHSVEQAAQALSIGRTKAWKLVGAGDIESVRIDGRTLVPAAAIDAFVAKLRSEAS